MESQVKKPVFRSPVVMLIDDQALVAHRVKDLLKNEPDITLHYCSDPAAAIAQARQIKPTVILMDLVMPNIDGLTLCRVFRGTQDTADIPIIMLSANDDGATKAHSFTSGADDYLVKLPDQIEFIARIRYHSKSYIIKLERDEAYVALCQSQLALEAVNARLQRMAHQDELTQLPNRPLLIDRLAMALAQAKRDKQSIAVLFLDLDNFKPINDLYGHQAGDDVLKTVAQRLLNCVRGTDTVARLGGDEFAIVLGKLDNPHYAETIAKKVIQSVSEPILLAGDKQSNLGVSIGISIFPEDGKEIDRLLAYADHAMYESKRGGKNRYSFFKDAEQNKGINNILLEFKEEYLCGIQLLDQQHIGLVHRLNHLNMTINSAEEPEMILALFDQLLDETRQHFISEEDLLEHYHFPGYQAHKVDHLQLLAKLLDLKDRFHYQGGELVLLQHIKTWLLNHIQYADKEVVAFLLAQGAR